MFPSVISNIIADYAQEHSILPWIDKNELYYEEISANTGAIEYLRNNPEDIEWNYLSRNPKAVEMLLENPEKIDADELHYNPKALDILKVYPDMVISHRYYTNTWTVGYIYRADDDQQLMMNPNSLDMLKNCPEKIDYLFLSSNPGIFTSNKQKILKILCLL